MTVIGASHFGTIEEVVHELVWCTILVGRGLKLGGCLALLQPARSVVQGHGSGQRPALRTPHSHKQQPTQTASAYASSNTAAHQCPVAAVRAAPACVQSSHKLQVVVVCEEALSRITYLARTVEVEPLSAEVAGQMVEQAQPTASAVGTSLHALHASSV